MNVADSEIVHALLAEEGYFKATGPSEADVMLINTCSIRDKAEERVWNRIRELRAIKKNAKIAVLGCMAERVKHKLLKKNKLADVVVGPDAYRDLPRLLQNAIDLDEPGINVTLSLEETYADIVPVRELENGVSAFVSIMRGCNNMCSYCIVPFTRGRERSRLMNTIVDEAASLARQGFKEITLLGQNVNSYNDLSNQDRSVENVELSKGFSSIVKIPQGGIRFGQLLEEVAKAAPECRIRFTSPHPKDFPDDVLDVIKNYPNVSKMVHIPAQSGSSTVLQRMRRGYSRESYLELIAHIKSIIPNISLSSDFISGFCGETEEEHHETLSLLEHVKYDHAYMFAYSQREKTHAHHKFEDNVPQETKSRRLQEVIATYTVRQL
jgi:tRNA-N(6)-(isopentenyl)adenosine-37 thiotransferase enzyme MiaB